MFSSYMYPVYRSPYFAQPFGFPAWNFPGVGGSVGGFNSIGSAIAYQSMNTIGAGAIGGTQIATPTVVW